MVSGEGYPNGGTIPLLKLSYSTLGHRQALEDLWQGGTTVELPVSTSSKGIDVMYLNPPWPPSKGAPYRSRVVAINGILLPLANIHRVFSHYGWQKRSGSTAQAEDQLVQCHRPHRLGFRLVDLWLYRIHHRYHPRSVTPSFPFWTLADPLPGQPSFIRYMELDTRPNGTDLLSSMNGVFQTGGVIGTLMLPTVADKYGRKWACAVVSCSFFYHNL